MPAATLYFVHQLKPLDMRKLVKPLLLLVLTAAVLSSCSHTISIERAASGHAGKCGRNHL